MAGTASPAALGEVPAASPPPSVEKLYFSASNRQLIDAYLPPSDSATVPTKPFVTLTYACSMDSQISISPGVQTVLSGPASKSMTHYLRTKHSAILIGSGTAMADDPGLNSRLSDAVDAGLSLQPTPVVIDRRARWAVTQHSRVIQTAKGRRGRGPLVVVDDAALDKVPRERRLAVQECGGDYITASNFPNLLTALGRRGIQSVMVEGGGQIINSILSDHADLVDSIIVTMAPVFLGEGGVSIRPGKRSGREMKPVLRLHDIRWVPLDEDVVMCARI